MTEDEDFRELKSIVESLIFASPDPVSLKVLVKTIDSEPPEHVE